MKDPMSETVKQMDLDRLFKNFEVLQNWEDRYRFIIEMGKKIPPLDPSEKTEENRVHGCISTVHMVINVTADDPPRIHFIANSDAMIVNGLIAIMQIIYDGQTAAEIAAVDLDAIFRKLGLVGHLSPNRRNGFFAIAERLRSLSGQ